MPIMRIPPYSARLSTWLKTGPSKISLANSKSTPCFSIFSRFYRRPIQSLSYHCPNYTYNCNYSQAWPRFIRKTSDGSGLITLFGSFAEIERDLISERTKEGLTAAVRKRQALGPPQGITEPIKTRRKRRRNPTWFKKGSTFLKTLHDFTYP